MSNEDWDIRIKPGSTEGRAISIIAGFILIISSIALVVTLFGVFLKFLQSDTQDLDQNLTIICVSALLFIIGIPLAVRGERQRTLHNEFETSWKKAQGVVVDRGITTRVVSGEDGLIQGASLRWVVIQFQAVTSAGLEGVKLRAFVSRKVYKDHIPGKSVVIQYSSANPQVALLEGE